MKKINASREPSTALVFFGVSVLLLIFLAGALHGLRDVGITSDETTHLPAGYAYWDKQDFRLNPQHPPLAKVLGALPLLFFDTHLNQTDPALQTDPPDEWSFGHRFLLSNGPEKTIYRARIPILLVSAIGGLFVFLWSRSLWGIWGGLLSLTFWAFCPNLLAHSRLVTTDGLFAATFTAALYIAHRFFRSGGKKFMVWLGVTMGLALAAKYSAVILIPLLAVLLLLSSRWGGAGNGLGNQVKGKKSRSRKRSAKPQEPTVFAAPGRRRRLRELAVALVVILLVSQAVVLIVGLFHVTPWVYWQGMRQVNVDHSSTYEAYCLGQFQLGGFWYYFPVAFSLKSTLATLASLILVMAAWYRGCRTAKLDELLLILPVLAVLAAVMLKADEAGVRYLLPVYPLLFVSFGRLASWPGKSRALRTTVAILVVAHAASSLRAHPHYIPYFHELVGGSSEGIRYLDDSNVDWGQDQVRARQALEERGIQQVYVGILGHCYLSAYGIQDFSVSPEQWQGGPTPGPYLMSIHYLNRMRRAEEVYGWPCDWLKRYEPSARIGETIYLFEFDGSRAD